MKAQKSYGMKNLFTLLIFISPYLLFAQNYFPAKGYAWETKSVKEVNINQEKLQAAIDFAQSHEYTGSRDIKQAIIKSFEKEPYHKILGETKERGGPAGMILKNGFQIASWGDIDRVDMTFSVTKSFLSTVAGLALDESLINSIDDSVKKYVWQGEFQGHHNQKISWRHLLNQSSDWYGQLWDGFDWADRPPKEGGINDWSRRSLNEPGTVFEYNDVRVNLLAYSLLQVWRKPLPMVLKEKIMDPIGASSTWRWYGYENSFVTIDGIIMQSVSGGGHSGGGMFISTRDMARFGLLFLNEGRWKDKQLLSQSWIKEAIQPSIAKSDYGLMWWLSPGEEKLKYYYAAGFGGNFIIIIPEKDMVVVTRWLNPSDYDNFISLLKDAL